MAASNIAVPFSTTVYASDASTKKGGLVATDVSEALSRSLWRTSVKKAKNPRLPSRTAALHRIHDESFEEVEQEEDLPWPPEDVSRPIGLCFDLELCGGAGVVSKEASRLGLVCGPVFDLSYSRRYDITDRRVFSWIAFMCEEGRLQSFLAAPPCTTFSPAAHPCLRTYKQPLGLDPKHPRVVHGNNIAFSCMGLLLVGRRTRTPGMMGADEVHLATCEYGSPHQKEFALLTVTMRAKGLAKKCSRNHVHVKMRESSPSPVPPIVLD